ncbi:hypothetical protein B0T22DRAFT_242574 [Podospora appendiculata]|uniref:SET domain-containing protein n=1 Tax=Podospora appendiculata TaxID=314037 RepID=A0AAE0X757_9PEZI|nr:hypothetical protein B0T22DRAFT_242574 [Podospora appendiculata]
MDVDGGTAYSEFVQQTETFLRWFQALPGATFHPDIRIEDLGHRNAGRGIIATKDIAPDTVLFTIPRSSILCAATSALATHLPSLFTPTQPQDSDSEDDSPSPSPSQDSWTSLILILLHEHLQGPSSPWAPYLSILPTSFSTPMFWTPVELTHLQASAVVSKIGHAAADSMLRAKILPVIRAHPSLFPSSASLTDDALLALAHRMGSAIMSYAFDLEPAPDSDDEEDADDGWVEDRDHLTPMGMVPMADMLNADAVFNAHINHAEGQLTATALRPIRAGEEILNYYGPLSNAELLRRYGYVTPQHARYDVVELPWGLIERRLRERFHVGMKEAQWAAVGDAMADEVEDSFVLEWASEEPDATGQQPGTPAVFGGLPEELDEQVRAFLKAVRKVNALAGEALEDKQTRKEIYLDSVLRALRDREAEYATRLEEDEQLVASGAVEGRQAMAVWVRKGEKQILRAAQRWVEGVLDELRRSMAAERDGGRGGDGPSAKRRRH